MALGQAGVGHAALLRDPSAATPRDGDEDRPLPRLDAADVELGLRYFVECRVLVIADELDERALRAALDGAAYHEAQVVLLRSPSDAAGGPAGVPLPPAATVLETPDDDPGGAFATLVGRYAAYLDAGTAAQDAWQAALTETGWEAARSELSAVTNTPPVVYGPLNLEYDFGPGHPLTPRRFPPSIELLEASGLRTLCRRARQPTTSCSACTRRSTSRSCVPSPTIHSTTCARRASGPVTARPFEGMHAASAAVAGGSIDAVDRILAGGVEHAFNPGGGLHHAMAGRASGFCIYNDVALAVARARDAGHRVLYVDLDVHHGDGTQALFWNDPQVLTFSIHESGVTLFPGTGFDDERGGPDALGTAVNVPLQPYSGNESWLAAIEQVVPALAEAFDPTFLVSQHGCDTHVVDPLAHLRLTTRAYRSATLLLDAIAHRHCGGRWLATGGGGYAAYRVVPRSWTLVWLAQAHREPPERLPQEWRERWTAEAERYADAPLPETLLDPPKVVTPDKPDLRAANADTARRALDGTLELLRR